MSQAKVDRYKEEKKNRAKIVKKEKREWMATKAALILIAVVMVGWVGTSFYHVIDKPEEVNVENFTDYTVKTDALDDYLNTLSE